MNRQDPMNHRRCRAKAKATGKPCGKWAMKGGFVCGKHGGKAGQVKRKAAERIRDLLGEAIDPDRVLRESGRIAFSDLRELYDDQGQLLPIKQWPDDIARAVAGMETETVRGNVDKGDGQFDQVHKVRIRLWDKVSKLTNLMKHHGQLKETLGGTIALEVKWKGE